MDDCRYKPQHEVAERFRIALLLLAIVSPLLAVWGLAGINSFVLPATFFKESWAAFPMLVTEVVTVVFLCVMAFGAVHEL